MKTKWTPGPWEVQYAIATNPVAVVYGKDRGDVAIIHRSSPTQHCANGIDTDEAKANAKLIRKAPEMVEALKEAIINLRHLGNAGLWTQPSTREARQLYLDTVAQFERILREAGAIE